MKIEWDALKNKINIQKHGVSFEEAASVFYDITTKVAFDTDHSNNEDRFLAIGYSTMNRLLMVIHCFRNEDQVIRIISARKATKTEQKEFEEL